MLLEGSCHCKKITFSLQSHHPYPFNLCYCSVCRKTAGSGGFGINLSGNFETLKIRGREYITIYQVSIGDEVTDKEIKSPAERSFCNTCGSTLWVWDPRWPDLVHPFASVIDTELTIPPKRTHLMLGSKASWVEVRKDHQDKLFDEYPDESIALWHQRLNLEK